MQTSVNRKTLLLPPLLLPLLLLASGSAWADWVKVTSTVEANFYVDPATLRKDGNLRKIWLIMDLKQRDTEGAISRRVKAEYDCKGERIKSLALSTHAEPMAGGTIIANYGADTRGWNEVPPGSAFDSILKLVCAQ